jgi:hypothetical protein
LIAFSGRTLIEGIDLHQFAGPRGPLAARQPQRVFAPPLSGSAASAPPQHRHALDHAARDEVSDDAADGSVGHGKTLAPNERPDFGAAPHRVIEPQGLDGFDQSRRPAFWPGPQGPPRPQRGMLLPAIEVGARHPDRPSTQSVSFLSDPEHSSVSLR